MVEYALVTAAFLALLIGLGALWQLFENGAFVEHAAGTASHHVESVQPGNVGGVLLY